MLKIESDNKKYIELHFEVAELHLGDIKAFKKKSKVVDSQKERVNEIGKLIDKGWKLKDTKTVSCENKPMIIYQFVKK